MARLLFTALVLIILPIPPAPASAQIPVTVRGRVVDATTRDPLEGARVLTSDSSSFVFTDSLGLFTIRIRNGLPLAVYVNQLSYFSQRFDLGDQATTRVSVLPLEPNPIALEGFEVVEESRLLRVIRTLKRRRNAYPSSVRAFERIRLERYGGSVWDFVRLNAPDIFRCMDALSGLCTRSRGVSSFQNPFPEVAVLVCVDRWESWGAVSELSSMDIQDVALVEIYARGRGSIRIYTPFYLADAANRNLFVANPYGCG